MFRRSLVSSVDGLVPLQVESGLIYNRRVVDVGHFRESTD